LHGRAFKRRLVSDESLHVIAHGTTSMRTAVIWLLFPVAAFAQGPPDHHGQPPVFPSGPNIGQGEAGVAWFSRVAKVPPKDYAATVAGVSWTMIIQDEYEGTATVSTPDGRTLTLKTLPTVCRSTKYDLSATPLVDRIRFTGAGGAQVSGAVPKPGDPYLGGFPAGLVPAGSTAVWKTVGPGIGIYASVQIHAVVGGQSVGAATYQAR
jgi:hypothetical protein